MTIKEAVIGTCPVGAFDKIISEFFDRFIHCL